MNHQLTEEQACELYRFNTAAAQYGPGLYCDLQAMCCHFPATSRHGAFTSAQVVVTVWKTANTGEEQAGIVTTVYDADDYDQAMRLMREQLSAHFGFVADPNDLLPSTPEQNETIKRLLNDSRITRPEKTQELLGIHRHTRATARAKAEQLQGCINARPLPHRERHSAAAHA